MSRDITDLIMTKYFINEKEKEIARLNNEIAELRDKLVRKCDHPTTTTTEHYNSGGYDYLSSVVITQKCTICDTVVNQYYDPKHKGSYA